MNRIARWILFSVGLLAVAVMLAGAVRDATPPSEIRVVEGYVPWEKDTLKLAESIPVQDGGRIKPLVTYAGFTMLRLYGARSMEIKPAEDAEEIRVKPLAWMLDAFFRPELSMRQPSFRVDDSSVLMAIGVDARERRDRYSYFEIEPGRDRLMELAESYNAIPKKDRSSLERQVLDLAENVHSYEQLLGVFAMSRSGLEMMPLESGAESKVANASAVMETAPVIREVMQKSQGQPPAHVQHLLQQVMAGSQRAASGLFLFPPADEGDEHWLSPGERVMNVIMGRTRDVEGSIVDIAETEKVSRAIGDGQEAFRTALGELKEDVVARAEARGEYRMVPLEADYYSKNWFLYALVWFLMGTVFAIGMWMTSGTIRKVLAWGVWLPTLAGLVYVIIPIVKRCIIMQRPPVGNLYDTIIFICAAVVMLGAVVELMTRRKIALGLLPIAGSMLILLARLFEVGDGRDHMDPLVAVLRSNYWLTIHVITITLGYAGGLVAALLGTVYVLLRGLRLDGGDKALRRSITRATYGMLCVTLFLSLVGTVLGGIWANDSWGRFWGWDPKENGALMIVLACLAILHARLGGFLKEWGINLAAVSLAAVVAFSWWGVNLLGTGLHNYGFTEGGGYIKLFYLLIGGLLAFGFIARAIDKELGRKREPRKAGSEEPPPLSAPR